MFSFQRRKHLRPAKDTIGNTQASLSQLARQSTAESDATLVDEPVRDEEETNQPSKRLLHLFPSPPASFTAGKDGRSRKIPLTTILQTSLTIGEATNIPYLKGLAGIVLVIWKSVQVRELHILTRYAVDNQIIGYRG